jgi:hypothetical protein
LLKSFVKKLGRLLVNNPRESVILYCSCCEKQDSHNRLCGIVVAYRTIPPTGISSTAALPCSPTRENLTIRRVPLAGRMADPDRVWMELARNLVEVTAMGRQASSIRSPMSSMENEAVLRELDPIV